MRKFCLVLFIAFIANAAVAQSRDTSAVEADKSSLQAFLDFGYSQALIKNQTDYQSVFYTAPGLSYVHKSGLGISASQYFFLGQTSGSRAFEFDLSASYDNTRSDLFSYGLAYTAYLFNKKSTSPKTPIRNDLYAYFSYDDFYLNPQIAIDYGFGTLTTAGRVLNGRRRKISITPQKISGEDVILLLTISHEYFTGPSSYLSFTPKIYLITSTENYYQNLHSTPNLYGKRLQQLFNSATGDGSKFEPRYAEASLQADYAAGRFDILPKYSLTMPISGSDRKPYGYFSGSLTFTF